MSEPKKGLYKLKSYQFYPCRIDFIDPEEFLSVIRRKEIYPREPEFELAHPPELPLSGALYRAVDPLVTTYTTSRHKFHLTRNVLNWHAFGRLMDMTFRELFYPTIHDAHELIYKMSENYHNPTHAVRLSENKMIIFDKDRLEYFFNPEQTHGELIVYGKFPLRIVTFMTPIERDNRFLGTT